MFKLENLGFNFWKSKNNLSYFSTVVNECLGSNFTHYYKKEHNNDV